MTSDDYLRGVGSALRDLPWQQRQELLAELRGHLADFPADTDLSERLGTPDQYAADLRAAEGLERRRGPIAWLKARRPRNVIATVVALILIGLAIGGVVWVQSYEPLADAGGGFVPAQLRQAPNGADKPLVFRKGGHFRFGIPIENAGSFGVRILGLGGWQSGPVALVHYPPPLPFSYKLAMTRPVSEWENQRGPLVPFRPFDLEPGKTAMLVIEAIYPQSCRPFEPGQVATPAATGYYPWDSRIPVRYHFLWKDSTTLIWPQFLLQVRFPKGCR
jgi:hypothetical protein